MRESLTRPLSWLSRPLFRLSVRTKQTLGITQNKPWRGLEDPETLSNTSRWPKYCVGITARSEANANNSIFRPFLFFMPFNNSSLLSSEPAMAQKPDFELLLKVDVVSNVNTLTSESGRL